MNAPAQTPDLACGRRDECDHYFKRKQEELEAATRRRSEAQEAVFKALGSFVCVLVISALPFFYLTLQYKAAIHGIKFEVDPHVIECSCIALTAGCAWAFGVKSFVQKLVTKEPK